MNRPTSGTPRNALAAVGSVRTSVPTKVPSGRIYPNGEFGLGYKSPTSLRDASSPDRAGGVSLAHQREVCEEVAQGDSPLGLSSLTNPHNDSEHRQKKAYGLRGMTNYGKKMVRNAAHLIEKQHGKSNVTFLTLTVPPLSDEAAVRLAQNWGEVMRQLGQFLSRLLAKAGLPKRFVLVSELQPQRLECGRLESLHIHGVFPGRKRKGSWFLRPVVLRAFWLKLLSRVSGEHVESDSVERLERVKKSTENYLSKYMSKGVGDILKIVEEWGEECIPSQWWNMSNTMRSEIKRGTLCGEGISMVLENLVNGYFRRSETDGFKFIKCVEVEHSEYSTFVVGFWGRMLPDLHQELLELASHLG